jgi:hypothetical protein
MFCNAPDLTGHQGCCHSAGPARRILLFHTHSPSENRHADVEGHCRCRFHFHSGSARVCACLPACRISIFVMPITADLMHIASASFFAVADYKITLRWATGQVFAHTCDTGAFLRAFLTYPSCVRPRTVSNHFLMRPPA